MNRIPFFNRGNNKDKQLSKEEQAKKLAAMRQACYTFGHQIFSMMAPGMTLELQIPLRGHIITPDKPQQYGTLIITKPGYRESIMGQFQAGGPAADSEKK